jgi:tetratricopeptide (TPR) repeat protein
MFMDRAADSHPDRTPAKDVELAKWALQPNWHTAIARALVYRARGEVEAAVAAYLQASELDPADVSALLDLADLLCERGEIATGVNYYLRAIERQPQHPWARPHYFYYQFFLHQDVFWQQRLQEYAAKHPNNPHAARLVSEIEASLAPEAPATINIIHEADRTSAQSNGAPSDGDVF